MRRLAIALAAGLLLAACGGNGSGGPAERTSPGGQTPTVSSKQAAAALQAAGPAAAKAGLLTLADMPAGWTGAPHQASGDTELQGLSPDCQQFAKDDESFEGELAHADSDDFSGPDGQQVSATAWAFPVAELSTDAMDTYTEALSKCRDELANALQALFQEGMGTDAQGIADVKTSFSELSSPSAGQESAGNRIAFTVSIGSLTMAPTIDFIVVRQGKMLGGLAYLSMSEPDAAVEQGLLTKLAGHLGEADASLPD